jgi:hypothetical protein
MITVLELAQHRGATPDEGGSISAAEIGRVGLPFWGGCERCGAAIACYNAYPSKSGYLRCRDCIGTAGWETVEQADADIFGTESR